MIPTVLDRFIQQAVMQVLQADWDERLHRVPNWELHADMIEVEADGSKSNHSTLRPADSYQHAPSPRQ